jgi:hypothetical protein
MIGWMKGRLDISYIYDMIIYNTMTLYIQPVTALLTHDTEIFSKMVQQSL